MTPAAPPAKVFDRGLVRCQRCSLVHDCYRTHDGGISWADPHDGHAYHAEPWEAVAFRYGYTPERERSSFAPVDPEAQPSS